MPRLDSRLEIAAVVLASWCLLGTAEFWQSRAPEPSVQAARPQPSTPAPAKPITPSAASGAGIPAKSVTRPDARSDAAEIRAFLDSHPRDPESARLELLYDQKLWPCPGERAESPRCAPEALIVAQGVLDRSERWLASCLACRERQAVQALRARTRVLVERLETERARREFERALDFDGPQAAAQVLADSGHRVQRRWLERAAKRLERRAPGVTREPTSCVTPESFAMLLSPASPQIGDSMRVLVTSESPVKNASIEVVFDAAGQPITRALGAAEGPPAYWAAEASVTTGTTGRALLRADGRTLACRRFSVGRRRLEPPRDNAVWRNVRGWDRAAENLYAGWFSQLFSAPENTRWRGLHEVTRERARNLLFDHLRLGEDAGKSPLEMAPDCADAPYYFRAYFAWKLGLPFGRLECRYGTLTGPPRCANWLTNELTPSEPVSDAGQPLGEPRPGRVTAFRDFLEKLKDDIFARSLRTELADDATDLYPLSLTRESLRPGSVFTDPYGHTLTLVGFVPQTAERDGVLLAVDAQPDGSLRIKRFWRGNFLFPDRHPIGGHGFKAFRPIILDESEARPLENAEIERARGYQNFSLAQSKLQAKDFYAKMAVLINPRPRPLEREYRELFESLHAQLALRVSEIEATEELLHDSPGRIVDMPSGREIFRTTGAWEALSTPCRDMRLLVGIDALLAFPEEAAQRVQDGDGARLQVELERMSMQWSHEFEISYRRSDGSKQVLSLAELIGRRAAFEMAYNPNDCPELRWGASEGSPELSSCARRAPEHQRRKMREYRHWFQKRYSCG